MALWRETITILASLLVAAAGMPAGAQDYPARTVTIAWTSVPPIGRYSFWKVSAENCITAPPSPPGSARLR